MKLADILDLLAPLNATMAGGDSPAAADKNFTGIAVHSKRVEPGQIFVAISGTKEDGRRFADEAIARGAAALVTQTPLEISAVPQIRVSDARAALADLAAAWRRYPARRLDCFGVTGTNGKTTSAYLLRSMLEAAGRKVGLIGTVGYFLMDRALAAPNTTPDALDLQGYLAEIAADGGDSLVMEVSSHALTQSRVRGIPFRAGIFTNLSSEHLDYHKTMEEYFQAKAKLFEELAPESTAVLNLEDLCGMRLRGMTRAKVVTYAIDRPEATLRATIHESSLQGVRFTMHAPEGDAEVSLPLPGRYNVMNFLGAAGAARAAGIPLATIAAGAAKQRLVPGRLERVDAGGPVTVLVDYAHTDDAMEKVLRNVRPVARGKMIVVFGCGGDRDRSKRPRMGRVGTELADFAVITSDNPRTEQPHAIIGEILAGVRAPESRYAVEPDRRKAIHKAIAMARPGDVVLLLGKGHENYQILGKETFPFDDREVAREALHGTH